MFAEASQQAVAITEALGWLRDLTFIGILIGTAWKARGLWDAGIAFFTRVEAHMNSMEHFARTVMENHMTHMQDDLRRLADVAVVVNKKD